MITAAARTPGRRLVALGTGVLVVVLAASALDPSPGTAGISLNPIENFKSLIGAAGDAAGKLGASVLQEALEWLLGGLKAAITLDLVTFLTTIELPVGGSLSEATGPIVVVGGFFLVVGLITSIGDGYREIVAGTDTAPRVIGQAIFRVIGLALLLGSWFWVVPLAVEVANGMSHYVLSDGAVAGALRRTFASESLLQIGFPLLGLLTGVFMAMAILILVVLKFVIAIAFATLYVGGPALIGFAALPRVGALPLAIATRGLLTLTVIPLAWTVVFVAWAGVSAGMFDAAGGAGGSVVSALMGPGLFLAGLIVMLAVTKKLLTMAAFGLRLSVPGAGMVRGVLNVAGAKALLGGAGVASQGALAGADAAARAPTKGGEGQPLSGVRQPVQTSGQPTAQTRRYRDLFDRSSIGATPANPQTEWRQREERRARLEETEREEQARDANAIASRMRRGVWRTREAPGAEYEALGSRVDELRTVWGAVPTDRVTQVGEALPAGDRSGFAAAAKAAVEDHPSDPRAAGAEFRHAGTNQYAGRSMSVEQREAVATVLAAPPETVWEAFRPDYERFQWREPEVRIDPAPARGYDPELFRFGGGDGGAGGGR